MRPIVLARPAASFVRVVRWMMIAGATLLAAAGLWLAYCEHRNSIDVPPAAAAELRERLARAEAWILINKERLLDENNSMLWLFIRDAGRVTGDAQLLQLANEYQARHTIGTPSQYFFDSSGLEQAAGRAVALDARLDDYQRLFYYGITCSVSAREDPSVVSLLSPGACDPHLMWLRSPWCHTHQLMGLRFVQKNHCEPTQETNTTVAAVQEQILSELRWDFRVEDAYIQKVMTLTESGRRKDIKPVWIRRILDAQRADGGWDGVDVLVRLPGDRVLAWSDGRLYPWVRAQPTSNFHATAQGLYLLALLQSP